mmetsp:Transcript_7065/g.14430  ORF Transcript_7065/g.14430 Transcript_7065/m.14430 type:complete len:207 (-) Transcript_7065:477-1097(-)
MPRCWWRRSVPRFPPWRPSPCRRCTASGTNLGTDGSRRGRCGPSVGERPAWARSRPVVAPQPPRRVPGGVAGPPRGSFRLRATRCPETPGRDHRALGARKPSNPLPPQKRKERVLGGGQESLAKNERTRQATTKQRQRWQKRTGMDGSPRGWVLARTGMIERTNDKGTKSGHENDGATETPVVSTGGGSFRGRASITTIVPQGCTA